MRIRARCPECGNVVSYDEDQSIVTCHHCGEWHVPDDLLSMRQYMSPENAKRLEYDVQLFPPRKDGSGISADQGAARGRGGRDSDAAYAVASSSLIACAAFTAVGYWAFLVPIIFFIEALVIDWRGRL